MGCASSKKQKQIESSGDLYNKDSDDRRWYRSKHVKNTKK